jgi:hypothetical protein
MCYRCGKHEHFITECPEAMEVKPEQRPRKSGGHKKKE